MLYWYKHTNTDAEGAAASSLRGLRVNQHTLEPNTSASLSFEDASFGGLCARLAEHGMLLDGDVLLRQVSVFVLLS